MNNFKTYKLSWDEKEGITSAIKVKLEKQREIIFAYIFGSFIDPEMQFFRDIDIGIYVDTDSLQQEQFINYALSLSLELESLLKKYPVDVIIINDAPLNLKFRITQGELLFTRDERLWTDFSTKTWSLYHDHEITSRNIIADLVSP